MNETDNSWKTKVLIVSTVIGAVSGLAAGYLLSKTAEQKQNGPPKIHTTDALKLTVGVLGLVRGIAALGDSD
jgi:hypothetical protein